VVKGKGWPYARPVRPRSFDEVLRGVARSVKSARRDLGISQEEAAHRAGIPVRQWQRVEAADAWTIRTLVAVASALGVDAAELFRR
jgi:ribosome-binding protein aMBF1 (putative translation factor)